MAVAKKWERERSAAVIAECGTGKTLISLAALHVHSDGRPFTAIAMAPGHITLKCARRRSKPSRAESVSNRWLRDRIRDNSAPCGVNEVKLRRGQIVREGLHTTLTDLRLRKIRECAYALAAGDLLGAGAFRGGAGQREAVRTFGGMHTRRRDPDDTSGA